MCAGKRKLNFIGLMDTIKVAAVDSRRGSGKILHNP